MSQSIECIELLEKLNANETVAQSVSRTCAVIGLSLTVVASITIPLMLAYFYYSRNKYRYLRLLRREFSLLFLSSSGILLYTYQMGYRTWIGPALYSCDLLVGLSFTAFILIGQANLTRAVRLYFRIHSNQALIAKTFRSNLQGNFKFATDAGSSKLAPFSSPGSDFDDSTNQEAPSASMYVPKENPLNPSPEQMNEFKKCGDYCTTDNCLSNIIVDKFVKMLMLATFWKLPKNVPVELASVFYLASTNFAVFYFLSVSAFLALVEAVLYLDYYEVGLGCEGCPITKLQAVSYPADGILAVIGLILWKLLAPFPDALGIKHELSVSFFFGVGVHLGITVPLKSFNKEPELEGKVDWAFVTIIGTLLVVAYQTLYQIRVARLVETKKIVEKSETLEQILGGQRSCEAFALYLSSALALENLYFYKSATFWRNNFKPEGEFQQRNIQTARDLYDLYINPESLFSINISYDLRMEVTNAIIGDGEFSVKVFDSCILETFNMLGGDVFFAFKQSVYYTAYKNGYILEKTTV